MIRRTIPNSTGSQVADDDDDDCVKVVDSY